ncbi:hypothetical protein FRC01_011533 [Tulasnella sp. 417]|nr:hypothetical protein FRC01_011533 [Tulasnella sp. 417]
MSYKLCVFILGGTGYLGGSILVELAKQHPEARFIALVRNRANNIAFRPLGVDVVNGTHEDLPLIEKLAAESDVVINVSSSDNLALIKAILAGLEKRARDEPDASRKPILIHTSGTGVLCKDLDGEFREGKVYDDNIIEDTKGIPDNAFHRNVDLEIFSAAKNGLIDAYIVAPCTIYGKSRGPLPRLSMQINGMIKMALTHKEVVQLGPATNVWNSLYIGDLCNFYALLFEHALSGKDKSADPMERFYWASGEEFIWGDVAKELAKLLYAAGAIASDTPKQLTLQDQPNLMLTVSNARAVSNRGPSTFGWKIQGPSLWETLPKEVEWTIAEVKAKARPRIRGL